MVKEKLFAKMSRKKIVAGNWKMNLIAQEAIALVEAIAQLKQNNTAVELMVFPPAIYIQALQHTTLKVGAQNFHPAEKGAFTGELSLNQLKDVGASIVLIGHSERRELFLESNSFLKENAVGMKMQDEVYNFQQGLLKSVVSPLEAISSKFDYESQKLEKEYSVRNFSADLLFLICLSFQSLSMIPIGLR